MAMKVEEGKIALSDSPSVPLTLERLSPPERIVLERASFEDAIVHLVGTIDQTVLGSCQHNSSHLCAHVGTARLTGQQCVEALGESCRLCRLPGALAALEHDELPCHAWSLVL